MNNESKTKIYLERVETVEDKQLQGEQLDHASPIAFVPIL